MKFFLTLNQGLRPLILMLILLCAGCKMIPLAILESKKGDSVPVSLNSHFVLQLGSSYYLHSVSRTGERPYFDGPWAELRRESIGGLEIIIEAPTARANVIEKFLQTEGPACGSAEHMLKNSIALSQRLLTEWAPGYARPSIVLRLLPANQGATHVEKTSGPTIADLKLYLLEEVNSGETCDDLDTWAYLVGSTVIHELSHIYAYQRFGFWFNELDNEYMASATEFCYMFAHFGRIAKYVMSTPGLDIDRKHILADPALFSALANGRIGYSLAGKIVADALKGNALGKPGSDGDTGLTAEDLPASNEICRRLHSRKPDLNDTEFIRYVYGKDL